MKKFKGGDFGHHIMEQTRIIHIHDEIRQWSVIQSLGALEYLSSISNKPITIKLCSPGGSVDHGLALYDYIKSCKVPIYTHCSGYAASMAAVLLGGGKKGKRTATKNSRIMIHQPSSGYIGKASDIEVHAKETYRIRNLLNSIISEDTKQPIKKVAKDTEMDYWLTAEEALKYGIIDKIV
jgi:ATP-dependent Clp protease protease subunit